MTPSSVLPATTLGVSIERAPADVYAFAADPRNFPAWAPSFCRGVRPAAAGWVVETPDGPMPIRFVAPNAFGVLDHYVGPGPGIAEEVLNPMRVVANGSGSEVTFTLFRLPGVSAERYAADLGMVRSDLATLKRVLEGRATRAG